MRGLSMEIEQRLESELEVIGVALYSDIPALRIIRIVIELDLIFLYNLM